MEFHYYYLIQDFVGVMLSFIGIRMFALCVKIISVKKLSRNSILLLIKYALYVISGVNLLMHEFGFKPWILSIFLIICSMIITSIVNAKSK